MGLRNGERAVQYRRQMAAAAQAGIDGVRSVDKKTMIVVGGDFFSHAA